MSLENTAEACFGPNPDACPDYLSECFHKVASVCDGGEYTSRYDNASAAFVMYCAILMFFMKAGFLFLEESFSKQDAMYQRRVVFAKYIDIFAGTFGFWLFGFAISANTDSRVLGEELDYIFWFFRFTFASNTATILGGTLAGQTVQMRTTAIFVYSFFMTAFIHPMLARFFWSIDSPDIRPGITWSPFSYCNGTYTTTRSHDFDILDERDVGDIVFIDFGGSGLVHLCGGIGGLMLAIFHKLETSTKVAKCRDCDIGCGLLSRKRMEQASHNQEQKDEPHDTMEGRTFFGKFIQYMYPDSGGEEFVANAALGIIILWTTWFAFNAGSAETISGKASHAAVGRIALVMCLSCASAGLVQSIICGLVQAFEGHKTINSNVIANALLSGLVAVTGCCPFIDPPLAVLIGILTVGVYHLGVFLEFLMRLHDGARIFPVHGMCGLWGVLCVGIFSKECLIRETYENLCFCINLRLPESISNQGLLFGYQLAGGLFIVLWSFVFCTLLFLIMWYIPVSFTLPGLSWLIKKRANRKHDIEFLGSMLFTDMMEYTDRVDNDDTNIPLKKRNINATVTENPGVNNDESSAM